MKKVYIIGIKRTPIGGFLSNLSQLSCVDLGKKVVNELLLNDIKKDDIECGYVGNVLSSGQGQNIGKQIMYECGLNIPTITINRVCSSGMQSVIEATKSIRLGDYNCVIAGGVESMSNSPYIQKNIRKGNKYGNIELIDTMLNDGLTDPFSKRHMGQITEDLCEKNNITRSEQDAYAKLSYLRAREAYKNGYFNDEVCNIIIKNRKGDITINEDEEVNKIPDLNKLETLRAAFKNDGTITAGNASKLSDGAAFMILANENYVNENNINPIAEIVSYELTAGPPDEFAILPVKSIENLCFKQEINTTDIDLFEVNEAFAISPIICCKELGINEDKMNIYGGAIALGHPIGCSGTRIISTLITGLKQRNRKLGCASICNGGGGATSLIIKNVN